MTLPTYSTGTVSVANGGTTVTGVGPLWASGANAREGDFFIRADGMALITEVTDDTHLQITPWPGATVAGGAYSIRQNYVGRVVGVAAAKDVASLIALLGGAASLTNDQNIDGKQNFRNTTDATGAGNVAAALFAGGVEIAKKLFVTGAVSMASTLAVAGNLAVNTNKFTVAAASGNTVVAGTLGVAGDLAINTNKFTVAAASGNTAVAGTLGVAGVLSATNATASSSTTTGAVVVTGGVGIGGAVNVGGNIACAAFNMTGSFNCTGTTANFGPGGTGTANMAFIFDGGSSLGGGVQFTFRRNSSNNWALAHSAALIGGANVNDLILYGFGVPGVAMRVVSSDNSVSFSSVVAVASGTATPAGGSTSARLLFGATAGFGIYYGSGAPTVSAAQGSLYIRTDGGASTRIYSNNNGTTGWSAITSA